MPNLSVHAASHGSVAVFIDWDNFAIGLREEMPDRPPDLGPVLRWVRQLGPVAVCRAYGEWRDAAERLAVYSAGVEVVYAPVLPLASAAARPNGGKSLADTEMAVDCVDFLHLIPEIATLVIVSSDKDLIPILRFAQRRGLRVFVVGSDRTAGALRDQSDDYVTYRTLLEQEGEAITTPPVRPMEVPPGRFARAPRLTPARSMLATPTAENTESSTTKADTGPSRATLRRRRGRRRRGAGTATPAASAAAPPAAASVEPPAPPEVAEREPDPAMVAPPPDDAAASAPDETEPPSADSAAAAAVAAAPSEPAPSEAAEESRPALRVLPGESLSRLKGPAPAAEPAPETPAEDDAPAAAVADAVAPPPAEESAEAPAEPAVVELVAPPAADGAPPSSNGTTAEDDTAAASDGTAEAPPEAEKKAKTTTRRRSTRRRSSTRGKTSTAKAKTAKSAKAAKATASDKKKAETAPAVEA